ncbi:hypothetical protein PHLGIDRAFT_121288 [Phlebiopsis gigantea 11061_1 CR5-6]|uniref:AB hydrolase-1 domain-containing protein n=1 Tax=Phlebiopsis gigantea (strain 11061_1 CR5-6) TaxID=745531 RepID=A0A0C3S5U8_PHLG1|nr:hypothetical protein PHLGIDRAFT_121288 [Phlebiopsis gigantea 11061_1 CR5-6]
MLHPMHAVAVPPSAAYPLHVTANCYRPGPPLAGSEDDPDALTFVFLHSAGFHKEMFEPTIDALFAAVAAWPRPSVREAWAVECPTHGESAMLNEGILRQPEWDGKFCAEEYARAAHHLLTSPGVAVDFRRHKVVGVGHSLGGVSMIFLAAALPFHALVLVDPTLMAGQQARLGPLHTRMLRQTYERRDTWASRAHAVSYLSARAPRWHPAILRLFATHALRPHPAARHAVPYNGVTLCCTRAEEATLYKDIAGPAEATLDALTAQCPVHLVFGALPDLMPKFVQREIAHAPTRRFASVAWLEGVGHLVPQEAPVRLAEIMSRGRELGESMGGM